MPYIKQSERREIDEAVDLLPVGMSAGQLNYTLTRIAHRYWNFGGQNYQAFNDILGAMDGAKFELYRRRIGPYEDTKIAENGDVGGA